MSRTVITIVNAHLILADDELGLATGDDFQCQVSSAAVNAVANTQTVPATFCEAESSAPSATGWELALTWLQDWTIAGGLSEYAFNNDTQLKWFSLSLDDTTAPLVTGQCYVVAGAYGGDAGVPLTATATWPLGGKPTLTPGTGTMAAAEAPSSESAYSAA
jgi:hypothetical protein